MSKETPEKSFSKLLEQANISLIASDKIPSILKLMPENQDLENLKDEKEKEILRRVISLLNDISFNRQFFLVINTEILQNGVKNSDGAKTKGFMDKINGFKEEIWKCEEELEKKLKFDEIKLRAEKENNLKSAKIKNMLNAAIEGEKNEEKPSSSTGVRNDFEFGIEALSSEEEEEVINSRS